MVKLIKIIIIGIIFNISAIAADFSDAPASYGTPSHIVVSGISIGVGDPDDDAGALPTPKADGDDLNGADDENGVTIPQLLRGTSNTIIVNVNGLGGFLQVWIDWNGNGNFADLGEQISLNLQDDGTNGDLTAGDGVIQVPVTAPSNASMNRTFARFRWSTTFGLNDVDAASDGEVEDYSIFVWGDINAVTPFSSCPSNGILVEGATNISSVNKTTGSLSLITSVPYALNAAGFNTLDGRVYARSVTPGNSGNAEISMIAVGSDGSTAFYGTPIPGMPLNQQGNIGDIDGNGYLHITGAGATQAISVVDVTPARPTFMTVVSVYSKTVGVGVTSANLGVDMAYNPTNGLFYSLRSGTNPELVTMNPATGQVNLVGTVAGLSGNFGAQYMYLSNQLVVIENTTGLRYRVDLNDPLLSFYPAGDTGLPNMTNNDAAGCPNQTFLPPTAANVSVGGRIQTSDDRGIRNVIVGLTLADGNYRWTRTGAFGYYNFEGITAGQTVTVSVSSKRFTFNPQEKVLQLEDSVADFDFTAEAQNILSGEQNILSEDANIQTKADRNK